MRRNRVWTTVVVALWLLVQLMVVSGARADTEEVVEGAATGMASTLATVFMMPVKLVNCVLIVALGGAGYGITMGSSEVVEQEFLGAIPSACGGKYYISQEEVEQPAGEPIKPR